MNKFEISPLTPQPEFPAVDLTEDNARMLAGMLANELQVQGFHNASESGVPLFRKLHPIVSERLPNDCMAASQAQAMSHGMTVFEAINAAVNSIIPSKADITALHIALLSPEVNKYFTDKFEASDARERLLVDMPRAAEVIDEASSRFYAGLGDYAVVGASVEREIILETLSFDNIASDI